jgi:hypothetical protein
MVRQTIKGYKRISNIDAIVKQRTRTLNPKEIRRRVWTNRDTKIKKRTKFNLDFYERPNIKFKSKNLKHKGHKQ